MEIGPDAAEKRVLDMLADILETSALPSATYPGPLGGMRFWTHPHATPHPGVCEMQQLVIYFTAAGPDRGADTEMRASSILLTNKFHFLTPPTYSLVSADDPRSNRECALLDPERDAFIEADHASEAIIGLFEFREVVEQAAAGPPEFDLECPEIESRESCIGVLADLALSDPEQIDGWARSDAEGRVWFISAPGYTVTILAEAGDPSGDPPVISKVIVEERVIPAGAPID